MKLNPELSWQKQHSIKKKENSSHQQTILKFVEEKREVPNLEQSIVWC
jgi:hypothetical protein